MPALQEKIFTYADFIKPEGEADTLLKCIAVNEARFGRALTAEERAEVLRLLREASRED